MSTDGLSTQQPLIFSTWDSLGVYLLIVIHCNKNLLLGLRVSPGNYFSQYRSAVSIWEKQNDKLNACNSSKAYNSTK